MDMIDCTNMIPLLVFYNNEKRANLFHADVHTVLSMLMYTQYFCLHLICAKRDLTSPLVTTRLV